VKQESNAQMLISTTIEDINASNSHKGAVDSVFAMLELLQVMLPIQVFKQLQSVSVCTVYNRLTVIQQSIPLMVC
jgi:hypothetical protein